jgi:DNA ligase (NAD+)
MAVPLEGIGPEIIASIQAFAAEPHNREVIGRLQQAGVGLPPAVPPNNGETAIRATGAGQLSDDAPSRALEGRTIVVTGTLPGLSRHDAEALIRHHGGSVSGSVSGKTHFVLAGDEPGSKITKAQQLGVPVISIDQLLGMIRDDGQEN